MTDTIRAALSCRRDWMHHRFDPYSGWCVNGCGNRDDGRVVSRSGDVINPGPTYNQTGLDVFRSRLEKRR